MDILTGDISIMVFRRLIKDDLREFSLDGQTIHVLLELDGKKSLAELASKSGMNMVALKEIVFKLLQLKLIEPMEEAIPILDKDFFNFVHSELSIAVGPLAQVLIEDAVNDLGHTLSRFPSHRAAEFIDLLSRGITREDKRAVFKQNMINKVKEKGY